MAKYCLYVAPRSEVYGSVKEPEYRNCTELNDADLSEKEICEVLLSLRNTLNDFLVEPVNTWPLSVRARNILYNNKLITLWDLKKILPADIMRLQKCGIRSMLEIYSAAQQQGYVLTNWLVAVESQYKSTFPSRRG